MTVATQMFKMFKKKLRFCGRASHSRQKMQYNDRSNVKFYLGWLSFFYQNQVRSLATLVSDSLTDSLTHSCLVNLIDASLACEDANSKLVEVVSVADVEAENHVGNILLQIWGPRFDHKAKEILS